MHFILRLISLFTTFLFGSSLVVKGIGNYNELNPNGCGFSRLSPKVDTKCFKWNNQVPSLKSGKNVNNGDAPWMALLSSSNGLCSGSVIANQWIITAAHCLNGSTTVQIYLGHNFTRDNPSKNHFYESNEIYIHPRFAPSTGGDLFKYDLALSKMNRPINTNSGLLSICLPNKWTGARGSPDGRIRFEYAMMAGRGGPTGQLLMAEWKISNIKNKLNYSYESTADLFPINHIACMGDSGSPVWQYYMGRAVIVAIASEIYMDIYSKCQTYLFYPATAMWVDTEIDWIKNVTQLD